ncbi:uncharacterized protein LOC131875183 [Cryptomeria japonica]|uniref:uncharacterized protein LOC131875183 n=1 Tax=Cryptomeria japonica TaxID=3369 RepID=UPI0027DA22D7|nr:uncharacterized protein LOC131875183 [Cryptomeria japonica]
MTKEDAIKFATLHLDGAANEWWYHGLVTLGHNLIATYNEFTNKLIKRFDTKDPEVRFRELAQLKQQDSLDAYISDFQKLAVMAPNITEKRLVVLFFEGLEEPLKGWVKAFDPPTLNEAIRKSRKQQTDIGESEYEEVLEEAEENQEGGGAVAQLSSLHKNESFRVRGVLREHRVITLIDTGTTHNFIDERIVAKRGLTTDEVEDFKVMVDDGSTISCNLMVSKMSMRLGNYEVKDDFYVVSIGGIDDAIFGIKWLRSLGEITLNLQTMELKFTSEGRKVVLRGMSNGGPRIVSLKRMKKLVRHGQVE